jgi:hypothetical protein
MILARGAGSLLFTPSGGPHDTIDPKKFVRVAAFLAPPSYETQQSIIGEEILECTISLTAYSYSNVRINGSSIAQNVVEAL